MRKFFSLIWRHKQKINGGLTATVSMLPTLAGVPPQMALAAAGILGLIQIWFAVAADIARAEATPDPND